MSLRIAPAFIIAAYYSLCSGAVLAQDQFPSKAITLVVPYATGGATDVTARRLAEALGKTIGTSVIVENRPGAATTLAAAQVARSPADGYTLLIAPGTTTSVNPYLYKSLSYNSEDFAPVSLVSRQPFAITVSPLVPSKSVSEFVNFGKGKSTPLTYATTGAGSMNHILGEWMGKTMGVKVTDIPYKGTAPAVIDLVAGRVDIQFEGITTAIPMHQSGKTRVVAVTSDARSPLLPDVPTLRESGYPDFVAYTYFGLLAPAATPRAVINKLHAAVVAAVSSPDFAQKLSASGESPLSSPTPKHYADLLRDENLRWGRIITPMNIKLD